MESIGYYYWCNVCNVVSFAFNCGCQTCNGSICADCEGYRTYIERQMAAGNHPSENELRNELTQQRE